MLYILKWLIDCDLMYEEFQRFDFAQHDVIPSGVEKLKLLKA